MKGTGGRHVQPVSCVRNVQAEWHREGEVKNALSPAAAHNLEGMKARAATVGNGLNNGLYSRYRRRSQMAQAQVNSSRIQV